MKLRGEKITRQMEEAISALLCQRNIEEAANAAGVATATLKRWLQLPKFAAAYRQARCEAVARSFARIAHDAMVQHKVRGRGTG